MSSLYVVSTPIGNLGDFTARAIDILKSVDLIAAEDTRRSTPLLQRFAITTPLVSYHDHSTVNRLESLLDTLLKGQSLALISDAGTPLISDPGYELIKLAIEHDVEVITIPGPCALIAALSVSGLPCESFVFMGFLPNKANARKQVLQTLMNSHITHVFYESSHRIVNSLQDMHTILGGDRQVVVCRELTKLHETSIRGTLQQVQQRILSDANQQKGEFVVLLGGIQITSEENTALTSEHQRVLSILLETLSVSRACSVAAKLTGCNKRDLYQLAMRLNPNRPN